MKNQYVQTIIIIATSVGGTQLKRSRKEKRKKKPILLLSNSTCALTSFNSLTDLTLPPIETSHALADRR